VCGDGGRAGVVAGFVQNLAQPHDLVFDVGGDRAGVVVGSS
jgi:hypothetical protein